MVNPEWATGLRIPGWIVAEMTNHLQAVFPDEGCGLLAGVGTAVTHHYIIENIRHSPTAFEMDPGQQLRAMLAVEDAGLTMLAVYHSHPQGPERPSPTDIALAYYPELVQIVVAIRPSPPVIRGFFIVAGKVDEIPIIVV